MISGKNHTVPSNVRFSPAGTNPDHVVWERGGSCSATGKMAQIRVKVAQIRAVRGLHEHVRHFMLQVTASASKRGNTAGRMTTNLNFGVESY
jgi:hypothetical protein